ncbi:MAG: thymidylate synthase [bacterium]|nr:thymidylate synthase [bacterium]
MEWPVFSEKELIVSNPDSSIGVCTLWSPRENFAKKYLSGVMDKVAVVGNLYSVFGIGVLIRNCLANPKLRRIIVSGTELGSAKSVLASIAPTDLMSKWFFLKPEHIRLFLAQVKFYFIEPEFVKVVICDFDEIGHLRLPLVIPLPEPKADRYPTASSGHLIRARTILEGYELLLGEIRRFGHITGADSEGHRRQELWQLTVVITDQRATDFDKIPHPEYNPEQIKDYCDGFWKGKDPKDLAYGYGHIIRFGFGWDQFEQVIQAFKNKTETFRTYVSLWNPSSGGSIVDVDPPCMCSIHLRIVGNALHMWCYIRTNDMYNGWSLNAAALRYTQFWLVDTLRIELQCPELELGDLSITSGSAHIYERDWIRVDAMLENPTHQKFQFDPKGNFEITTDCGGEEILARHFSPSGELLQEFRSKSARELSEKIAPFISRVSHALYLGREIERVSTQLKQNKSVVGVDPKACVSWGAPPASLRDL